MRLSKCLTRMMKYLPELDTKMAILMPEITMRIRDIVVRGTWDVPNDIDVDYLIHMMEQWFDSEFNSEPSKVCLSCSVRECRTLTDTD